MRATETGRVTVYFSDDINVSVFSNMIGKAPFDLLSFKVDALDVLQTNRLLQETSTSMDAEEYFKMRNLHFSWILTAAVPRALQFQLNFTTPLDVSAYYDGPDELTLMFNPDPLTQIMVFDNKILPEINLRVKIPLKKQFAPTIAAAALESASEGSVVVFQALFFSGLVLQLLGDEALRVMQLMIRQYQFILHLPMLQLIMPANIMMLYGGVIPVACWDMLEGWIDWENVKFFSYTVSGVPMPGQIDELGYEGTNWIPNTQTIAIIAFFLTVKLLMFGTIRLVANCCPWTKGPRCRRVSIWFYSQLFFRDFIKFTFETQLELIICGYLAFCAPHTDLWGDILSLVYASIGLLLALVFMPIMISIIWKKRFQVLQNPRFLRPYGELYSGMRTKDRKAAFYLATMMYRRVIFVFICFFFVQKDIVGLQW
jgi:hypothetical protein